MTVWLCSKEKEMAYTVSFPVKTVFGDKRVHIMRVVADAATQTVETGFKVVDGVALSPCSLSTAAIKIYANSNASGVQSFGVLGLSGLASGDDLFITVFGH
jgi:hypothetical protein